MPLAGNGEVDGAIGSRAARPGPRQVAPAGGPAGATARLASGGPTALPVIILIGVVLVLALGVVWLVLTGDDSGPPASERAGPSADAATPTDVRVNEVPEGVQVAWDGSGDASYVVTVLSADAPPEPLPATIGTSALVPNVAGVATGPRCFTVSLADDAGTAASGAASEPACTAGATADQMQGG